MSMVISEIPVIALDLQRLILPSKSQIWAVLRKTDPLKRIAYSVCAGMYGVLCISGDVFDLSDEQWSLAREGVDFAIASKYEASDHKIRIEDNCIKVYFEDDFDAVAIYLKKK